MLNLGETVNAKFLTVSKQLDKNLPIILWTKETMETVLLQVFITGLLSLQGKVIHSKVALIFLELINIVHWSILGMIL